MNDDTLEVYLSNGTDEVRLEAYNGQNSIGWHPRSFRITDHILPTATMQLRVTTTEQGVQGVLEAGFDAFAISEGEDVLGVGGQNTSAPIVWPNPVNDRLFVSAEGDFQIVSPEGMVVMDGLPEADGIDVSGLAAGIYFVRMNGKVVRFVKE